MADPNEIPAAKETPNDVVKAKLADKKTEFEEEIQDAFDEATRISKVGEVAYVEASKNLPQKQIRILDDIFNRYEAEIATATGNKLDSLYDTIVSEAKTHADTIKGMINIVASKDGNTILNENEIHELGQILEQSTELSKKHPEMGVIIDKLSERKKLEQEGIDKSKLPQLTEADYDNIIQLLDVTKIQDTSKNEDKFTQSTIGSILALMDPAERVKLIETMMDSDKEDDVAQTIDVLTRQNVLTIPQARYLFQRGNTEGIQHLENKDELDGYLAKLENEYPQAQQKIQEKLNEAVVQLKAQYAQNEVDRFFGLPMIGYAMKLHSIIWLVSGFLVSKGDMKEFLTSPYTVAAAGELLISKGVTDYGGTVGAKWGGLAGIIDRLRDDGTRLSEEEAKGFNDLGEIYNYHPDFINYLKKGGAGHVLALKKKFDLNENHKAVTSKDVMEYEEEQGTDDQLDSLQDSFDFETKKDPQNQKAMDELFQKFTTSAEGLGIKDQKSFEEKIALIERAQGINQSEASPKIN